MIASSVSRKDKNEIVPCMVDKPITHLLNLLESHTAPLAIINNYKGMLHPVNSISVLLTK